MLAWIMLRYDGWLVHAKINCDVFMTLTNDITPVDGMKYMIYYDIFISNSPEGVRTGYGQTVLGRRLNGSCSIDTKLK